MSIITTFESQCRSLTSTSSPDEDASRFLVGTLSPNGNNLLYLFEYKDETSNLAKVSFKFPFGEIWHLSTSARHSSLVAAVSGEKKKLSVGLFKLPSDLINSSIEDDYGLSESVIEQVAEFECNDIKNLVRQSRWHPEDGNQLLTCSDYTINFWDIDQQKKAGSFSLLDAANRHVKSSEVAQQRDSINGQQCMRPSEVTDLRWSSLFDCSVVAAAFGSNIYGIDTRIPESSPSSICWLIEDQRCVRVRSIDFNPNSQYYIVSGGDDCRANFWDLRQTSSPVMHLQNHTHWIWSIRYNPFHDQLVLSAGSDGRVALMRAQSVASDPYGQIADYGEEEDDDDADRRADTTQTSSDDNNDDDDDENRSAARRRTSSELDLDVGNNGHARGDNGNPTRSDDKRERKQLGDEIIQVYQEHEDAVYAAEWATDPWIFASLGLESRLVISRVPKEEKFHILF